MKRDWLWDRKTSLKKIKRIFTDSKNPEYIRWAALLLARKNTPSEIFSEYLDPLDFCRKWVLIKKAMHKDAWNNPRIIFWQAVYEKLMERYRRQGRKIFIKNAKKPPHKLCQEVGGAIRSLRKSKDLTQRELSTKLGVSQQLISRIEGGYENLSILTIGNIAKKLGARVQIRIHKL